MSDIDRVKEMVDEGRITKEEADQLIAVLREVEAAEANLDAAGSAGSQARPAAAPVVTPEATTAVAPEATPQASSPAEAESVPAAPQRPVTLPGEPAAPAPAPASPAPASPVPATPTPAIPTPPVAPPPAAGAEIRAAAFSDAARDIANQAREAAREASRAARDAAREARGASREAAREASRSARDAVREASRDVRQAVSGAGRPEVDDIGERPDKGIAPADTPWVVVEMIGGDLDITVDPTLEVPVAEGGPGYVEVAPDEDGYKVRFMPEKGNFLDRILSSVRSGDLDVRIPPHFGVSVQATAGDVDLHGVRYLRGRLRAGDVTADRLEGVDFSLMAGDFEATLDLKAGDHVITVGAGEANVALSELADVTVTGRVSIGDLASRVDGLEKRDVGLGGEVAGSVGAGNARLRLRVTTGDLTIRGARTGQSRG